MSGVLHVEHVMGSVVTIDVRWPDGEARTEDDHADAAADAIARGVAKLHQIDRVFSTWRTDSDLSRLRRGEITVVECDPSMITVIDLCTAARELTDGWFDPWRMPGGFDPTGLVKGWAAEQVSDTLTVDGFTNHCVNAGGDVVVRGDASPTMPYAASGWRIGVTDPSGRRAIIDTIVAHGVGVATSGDYERGSLAIDPRTGRQVARLASATVVGPDLALADSLATAATAAGTDLLTSLERIPDYVALLIGADGSRTTTTNWLSRTGQMVST